MNGMKEREHYPKEFVAPSNQGIQKKQGYNFLTLNVKVMY